MKHRDFILKVIRIRRRLIQSGDSKLNLAFCTRAMNDIERWIKFYPKATEKQLRNYFIYHSTTIGYLMPGANCKAHAKLSNQYAELL